MGKEIVMVKRAVFLEDALSDSEGELTDMVARAVGDDLVQIDLDGDRTLLLVFSEIDLLAEMVALERADASA